MDSRVTLGDKDTIETLTSRMGTGGGNVPLLIVGVDLYNQALTGDKSKALLAIRSDSDHTPCAITFVKDEMLCVRERCGCDGGGKGILVQRDVSGTIATNNDQFIVYAIDRAAFNQGKNAKYQIQIDDNGIAHTLTAKGAGAVCYELGKPFVRRLTPTECARLQGMPDWWCKDIPHSDSAEYKMWGNGMALPCVLYVMQGVADNKKKSLMEVI